MATTRAWWLYSDRTLPPARTVLAEMLTLMNLENPHQVRAKTITQRKQGPSPRANTEENTYWKRSHSKRVPITSGSTH